MCGIAGLCGMDHDSAVRDIKIMTDLMKDRGPDAEGVCSSPGLEAVFGHRRLSIIDLTETGAQPMVSEDGRFIITYNGEIYNHAEIRDELLKAGGRPFRGRSDTEVFLRAFEEWGDKAPEKLKGMFAAGIYDCEKKELTLMRDRVGEKPLYYGWVCGGFAFASSIAAISALPGFESEIDRGILHKYFLYGYIPAPNSIWKDVKKLEPGSILKVASPFKKDSVTEHRKYWDVTERMIYGLKHPFKGDFEEASEELEKLLLRSVDSQMVSDVPLGAFLSGGIDSSTIVSLMQKLAPGRVRTFTVGMKESGFNEAEIAAETAKILGTEHTEMYIGQDDMKAVIPHITDMFGEPFADSSQIPTYLVSRMTREHVTVSLSGDAGDELFSGYTSYASVNRIWNKMKNVPYPLRSLVSKAVLASPLSKKEIYRIKGKLLSAETPGVVHDLEFETDPVVRGIVLGDRGVSPVRNPGDDIDLSDPRSDCMLMDLLMYHPDDILTKVDRTAMAVSLETRIPFLDRDVMEFAFTIPVEMQWKEGRGKQVLRNILYRYVPRELMDRPKKGFGIPIETWLREGELRNWAMSLLDEKAVSDTGCLNPETVARIRDDFYMRGVWRPQLWYILMFMAWYEGICRKLPSCRKGRDNGN
ncbi:MAG: asparagine synthase (glutamine-hydrolyzing) [Lachnospiraceae bacterium]|nr:asparagine synthase (glutamine-hydrolyzing) [Lachnospiraceae bacterium]